MEKRKIPMKNYLLFALLAIVSVILVFYLGKWYQTTSNFQTEKSSILSVISEIRLEEMDNYLMENPNGLLFISAGNDEEIKDYENMLKEIIMEYDLRDEILYLDQNSINDHRAFVQKYFSDGMQSINFETPNLILFQDGKVIDVLKLGTTVLGKEETLQFLRKYEVIEA